MLDYNAEPFNIEAGLGFGLTPASDRLVVKLMISRDLYQPLQQQSETRAPLQSQRPSRTMLSPAW